MNAGNLRLGLMLGFFLSAAIVATNVIWPWLFGHPSPDTAVTESVGWIFVVGVVCGAGYLKMRRSRGLREAAIAGGTISFVAFGMVMLTFLVIDNLFLGIVAQQPEKIWAFEHSGIPDMRTYLNHANLRAFWTVLPAITAVGAMCGIIGGSISRFARTHRR